MIIKIILYISIAISVLSSSSINVLEAKLAIKMVKRKNIKFISAEETSVGVINSLVIPIKKLYNVDVLGNHICSPLYACFENIEKIIEDLDISKENQLIIYDKSYGIYATTLYATFESMGYKHIALLNGGYASIAKLDPNQKAYNKYVVESNKVLQRLKEEKNKEVLVRYHSLFETLKKKKLVLEPLLLIQKIESKNYQFFKDVVYTGAINLNYLSTKLELKMAVEKIDKYRLDSNMTLIDSCPMVNILENNSTHASDKIKFLSWKNLIDVKKQGIKSKKLLEKIFQKAGLKKENTFYLYCMTGAEKAFYMQVALRIAEYNKVKVFTGNGDTWIGAKIE
jgi:3-mercaptopyruvate sulfurtransferase SseA